jgi:hypothetical protein
MVSTYNVATRIYFPSERGGGENYTFKNNLKLEGVWWGE